MRLIITENSETVKNVSSIFDYNAKMIILSKSAEKTINLINWTELYVAVSNEEFFVADLKVAKTVNESYIVDFHEISNWINELKNLYIYNHIDNECTYFKRISKQEIIKTTRKSN